MSVTGVAYGAPAVAGFKFHTNDWNTTNTGTALGAGDGIELLPEGTPTTNVVWAENLALVGGVGIQRYPTKAHELWSDSVSTNLSYSSSARFIAGWWGAEAVDSSGASDGYYTHTFTFAPLQSYQGTFAYTDGKVCHDIAMCKPGGLAFSWTEGMPGKLATKLIGKRELIDDSGANTFATVNANVTLPTSPVIRYPQISSAQCAVWIDDASGTLNSSDARHPSAINLQFERSYKQRLTSRNIPYIDEPVVGAWIPATGSLTFPLWDTTQDWTDIVAGTEKKMSIVFSGSTIGGGVKWQMGFYYPSVRIESSGLPKLNTPDLLELTFNFTAHHAWSTPAQFSAAAPYMKIVDTESATHLTNGV